MDDTVNVGGVWCVYSDCITCGVRYTVPQNMWNKQRREGGFHHCPNGHSQGWGKGDTEMDKLRRERDRLKQEAARLEDDARHARFVAEHQGRRAAAFKGQATKLRKRVKAGVCPCCNRTFQNLQQHMKGQHPDWQPELEEPKLTVVK